MNSIYLLIPVLIGLVTGIGLIVVFTFTASYMQYYNYRPPPTFEQQRLVDKVISESKEAQNFLARFPLAPAYVSETAVCIDGCLDEPPLIKKGIRIEFSGPQIVSFPSRAFHGLRLTVDLDSSNNIEDIKLTCFTGYEHGTSMGSSIPSINLQIIKLQQNPRWADYCS